jgi:pimeloyl-ACP methyl ester carboxylesterase
MRPDLERFGSPFRHRVGDVVLNGMEVGPADGPLVILLHGFPEFWWGWRRQIEPLAAAGFRVVVPDQRGYNLSDKPEGVGAYRLDTLARDVIGLADVCGRPRFHVIGHDWGGLVAWWTASRYRDRVERLVALNAPHPAIAGSYMLSHPTQMMRSFYVSVFQVPWLPEVLLRAANFQALRNTLVKTSRRGTFPEDDLALYEEAWRQPGALTAMVNWYRALRLRPRLPDPRVAAPTLAIWGMRDRFLEEGLAVRSLALCQDGRLLRIESATHWLHLEEAEAVNAAIIPFLRA